MRAVFLCPGVCHLVALWTDKKAASRLPPVKFRFDRWAAGVRRPDGSLEPP
jgi:hypothetical protein